MTRQELLARRDYFDMVHGVTMRAVETLTDEELDFRPQAGMRTPRELVFHVYAQERTLAEAVTQGAFTMELATRSTPEDPAAADALAALTRVSDLRAYAEACHTAANVIARSMTDEAIARSIASPFGTYPAWQYFQFAYDEHWHHRGQLYVYLRLLGKEPPMIYDYQPPAS